MMGRKRKRKNNNVERDSSKCSFNKKIEDNIYLFEYFHDVLQNQDTVHP